MALNFWRCKKVLKESLGVEPSDETQLLFQRLTGLDQPGTNPITEGQDLVFIPNSISAESNLQVVAGLRLALAELSHGDEETVDRLTRLILDAQRAGQVRDLAHLLDLIDEAIGQEPIRRPAFLWEGEIEPGRPPFVGRQPELNHLNAILEDVQHGHGQATFVVGDAGSGKTSLLKAFAAQVSRSPSGVMVAWGNCNAFSGPGDPYLPFRQALSMLTGDLERAWSAGVVTTDQARRLWKTMPVVTEELLDYGPDLLDTLVPVRPLLNRLESAFPAGHPLAKRIEEQLASGAPGGRLERTQLFEQISSTLRRLAEQRPVVLFLDDLQWADTGSLELLFHLGRSLAGAQILLLSAYRPDEVTRKDHPLRPLLDEFRGALGNIWLDLNRSPGRAFVDAFIDSEPNRLDQNFRDSLYRTTGGHPLFTVELIRDMQLKEDLFKDRRGLWSAGPSLDWSRLPARIDGAVESRLGRLDQELRDILTVAAVEGETFTAQVISQTLDIQERRLIQALSRDLAGRFRLVSEVTSERIGGRLISRYRFAHQIFPRYLYDHLSLAERQFYHGQVGQYLEELFVNSDLDMAVQLARHFDESGEATKAVKYLLFVGDQARTLYAQQEAVDSYERAVQILEEQGDKAGAARVSIKLGLAYHNTFRFAKSRQAYEKGFHISGPAAAQGTQTLLSPAPHSLRLLILEPESLDPAFGHGYSTEVVDQLFSGLVELTPDLDIVPDVARSWQVLDGGRRYLFKLRQDVCWSDGVPVTAVDFEYAWKRVLDPATGAPEVEPLFDIKGARAYNLGKTKDSRTVGVRAIDDWTLEVEAEQPAGHFLNILAYALTRPVPRHVVSTHGADWAAADKVVTNGPFQLAAWESGQSMELLRNPNYPGRLPGNVERIALRFESIPETAVKLYQQNQVDSILLNLLGSAAVQGLRRYQPTEFFEAPLFLTVYIGFNYRVPPFNDRRVRQAIAHAIDREDLVDIAYGGQVAPAGGGFVPPGMPGHAGGIALAYDPGKARRLLAEAGYPGGSGFPTIECLLVSEEPLNQISYLQEHLLDNLNIAVELSGLSYFKMLEQMYTNPPGMWLTGWLASYPDPYDFLGPRSWRSASGWQDAAYEQLIEEASSLMDQSRRLQLYQQADKKMIEQAAIIPLIYDRWRHLRKPWVRRFPVSGMKDWHWKDVIIDTH